MLLSIFHLPSHRSLVMMATDSPSISCTYLPSYYTGLVTILTSHAFRVCVVLILRLFVHYKNREYSPEFTFQFLFVCVLGFGAHVLKPPLALYCDFPALSLRFSHALLCIVAPLCRTFPRPGPIARLRPRLRSATATP